MGLDTMLFGLFTGQAVAWWLLRKHIAPAAPTATAQPAKKPEGASPYREPDSPADFPSPRERLVLSLDHALRMARASPDLSAEESERLARDVVNHLDEYLASGKDEP